MVHCECTMVYFLMDTYTIYVDHSTMEQFINNINANKVIAAILLLVMINTAQV